MAFHSAHAGVGVDWNARYVAGDTPWDKGAAHPALLAWLGRSKVAGSVLVPGCGAGHDVRALAARGASRVVGIDIAPSALRLARSFPKAGNESYVEADFLAGDALPPGSFDILFEHTCFCAIPPQRRSDYARAALKALSPGGLLVAVFFTNPDNPDPQAPPFRCDMVEIRSLFSSDFEILDSRIATYTYQGREGRETLCLMQKRKTA
ncbi:MAG: methyltransferase domain-containing protein [bacterium]